MQQKKTKLRAMRNFAVVITLTWVLLMSFIADKKNVVNITVYTDSVVSDVAHHPVGINLNYFIDGGRFPNATRTPAQALKAMGVKYLRYPGGDKSDFNLFSIPPYEKSLPTLARTGKGATDDYAGILRDYKAFKYDVLDFDEFMALCRNIGAEPVVVVPADGYLKNYPADCTFTDRATLIEHAAAWVRYANITKKYHIKYWMIGNECWNENNQNSTAAIYAQDVLDFSKAMKAVDPSIATIPNGNKVEDFAAILNVAGDYVDYLCLSNYPVYDYRAGYATYRDTLQNLMGPVDRALTALKKYGTPKQQEHIKLIVAEYGPFDWKYKWPQINDMGHNLLNFEMAGEQLLQPAIEFSCFWNTRWIENDSIENEVWDALDKNGGFNANGYGLSIWGNYLGEKMLKTTSTLHIRSFASITSDKKRLFVYLVNKEEREATAKISVATKKSKSVAQAWELVGKNADDCDPLWLKKPMRNPFEIPLKGTSITVVEYNLQ